MDITVVIPTIPSRKRKLYRAVASVLNQTYSADAVVIRSDLYRKGSADTRNRGLASAATEWVAFLDDDDEFLPDHLGLLCEKQLDTDADVVYPLPLVIGPDGREIPRQWDWGGGPEFDGELLKERSYINICSLVRTRAARQVGGFEFVKGKKTGQWNDDHGFYLRLYNSGYKFAHIHHQTFVWNHHGQNTSGRPGKGDAK